jgi:hypothetical protein
MGESLRGSGTGDLTAPRTDHTPNITKGQANAVPRADEPVIKGMESAAQDGTTAGSMSQDAGPPQSNGALGKYRDAIVPPPGTNVP